MSQNRLVAKHYWLNPGPWCKPSESTKRSAREHYAAHVARTAFQITGAVLSLIRSFPRLNGPFLIRCMSSMPAMVIEVHRKRFNPSIGPKQSLIVRWSCSNRLISGMCRRDTQIRVSWSLGINFRWASDWGVGSTYSGQAAIFDELRARVVIWPPPSTNPNLRIIDIAAVSRIAHLLVP